MAKNVPTTTTKKDEAVTMAPEKHCAVPGCERPHAAQGYCWAHYQRAHRAEKKGKRLTAAAMAKVGVRAGEVGKDVSTRLDLARDEKLRRLVDEAGVPMYEYLRGVLESHLDDIED